jgi:hypothetical protein
MQITYETNNIGIQQILKLSIDWVGLHKTSSSQVKKPIFPFFVLILINDPKLKLVKEILQNIVQQVLDIKYTINLG